MKLYTVSFAKCETDTPATGTFYFTEFINIGTEDTPIWTCLSDNSRANLTRDEQFATLDVISANLVIPGCASDDPGFMYDRVFNYPTTPRLCVGLTEDVKELHCLSITSNGEVLTASTQSKDLRTYVQQDYMTIITRLFKNLDENNTVYVAQENSAKAQLTAAEKVGTKAESSIKLKKVKAPKTKIIHIETQESK